MIGSSVSAVLLCVSLFTGGSPGDRWLGVDKVKHFFASFVVTSLSASGARAAGLSAEQSLAAGVGIGTGVGVWKEIRDHRQPGETASFRDLVWDGVGVAAGAVVVSQSH